MTFARYQSLLLCLMKGILPLVLLLAGAVTASGACNKTITSGDATGNVGVPFTYQITVSGGNPQSYDATGLPPGLTVNTSTGVISGTPTTIGAYPVTLSATYNSGGCTTVNKNVTFTILSAPTPTPPPNAFVGFRLPDFPANPTPAPTPAANNMRLMLQMGATQVGTAHPFNATLEVQVPGTTTWVPYNRFVGVDDSASWITDAPLPVRDLPGSSPAPTPYPSPTPFNTTQLTESPPGVYMKADPRSTRFGIFQEDSIKTGNSRIIQSLWPMGASAAPIPTPPPNGYGGVIGTTFSPTTVDVEHAPLRFFNPILGSPYYPATFAINGPVDARDNATTIYADNDNVTRSADAKYSGAATTTGSSTPYYPTSTVYRPIILNRPFRNVGELGYAFRDLPWKTLDFFTDKSADAGLLDIFTINDGPRSTTAYNANGDLGMAAPPMVAGQVNLNSFYLDPGTSTLAPVAQPVLAGALWDDTTLTVSTTGNPSAQTMAANIVGSPYGTSVTPMQNKAELITRAGLATQILPLAANDNQAVKTRREVVPRAVSSASQTRVWNLLIDVVAQSGHYKANANSLANDFVVEGEQHYWVHVAIDRFTGEVLGKQIEVVNE
jgi:hypothetical protein